jgi:hypothetical protein
MAELPTWTYFKSASLRGIETGPQGLCARLAGIVRGVLEPCCVLTAAGSFGIEP